MFAVTCTPRLLPPSLLLLLLPLLLAVSISPQGALWPCPAPCTCREDHVGQVGRAYAVLCSNHKLQRVPDLSALAPLNVSVMLKLDYCQLGEVSRGDFPPGLQLAVLHLNGNAGLRLAGDALYNVRDALVLLDLQAVNLPFNASLRFLQGCSRLQELSLNFNNKGHGHAAEVTAPLFQGLGLAALAKLNMFNCNLRSLAHGVFQGAEGLRELHLGSNQLREVPPALTLLPDLRVLDLSSNQLSRLNQSSFSTLTQLRELKLRRNQLAEVEEGAFTGLHGSLTTLVLDFCALKDVPTEALRPLRNLTSLDLTSNLFSHIGPDAFVGSYCLSELYVSSPSLAFERLMFTGQKFCLKDLKIRSAGLTSVPLEPLQELSKLQYLFLDKNNMTRLSRDGLRGITATSVSFSDNPLRSIEPGAFSGLRPKLILLLERTELSDLSFIFHYPADTFRFLSLYESPIPCDCTLKRLLEERPENFLYGTCSHGGLSVNMRDAKLREILARECRAPPSSVLANLTTARPAPNPAVPSPALSPAPSPALPHTLEPQVQRRDKQKVPARGQEVKGRKDGGQGIRDPKIGGHKAKSSKRINAARALSAHAHVYALLLVLVLVLT